jgi:hypothetical protein
MVTSGEYEDYGVHRVFEDRHDAERFALEYNATRDPFTSAAEVEEVDFVPARRAAKTMEVVR